LDAYGRDGKAKVDTLLGNHVTKIFHRNGDPVTNEWASKVVAKETTYRHSISSSGSIHQAIGLNSQTSVSEVEEDSCPPKEFIGLKNGGQKNNFIVLEAGEAKELALDHLFESVSVVQELHAAAMLLRRGIGRVSVGEVLRFASSDPRLLRAGDNLLTTREVLAEEIALLEAVQAGRGKHEEMGRGGKWSLLSPLVEESPAEECGARDSALEGSG
jgi:hypothetical protein